MPDTWVGGEDITATKLNQYRPFLLTSCVITANSSTITSTTEVAIITSSSVTLKNGRAYRFVINGLVQHATINVIDILYCRLRRTSSVGTSLRNFNNIQVGNRGTASRNTVVNLEHTGVNNSGSDITDVVVFTGSWDTGSTATFTFAASAGTPMTMQIWDVGPSSDFVGFTPIT